MFNRQLSRDGVLRDLGFFWIPRQVLKSVSAQSLGALSLSGLPEIIYFLYRGWSPHPSLSHLSFDKAFPFSGERGSAFCNLSIPDISKPYLLHFLGEFELLPIKNE